MGTYFTDYSFSSPNNNVLIATSSVEEVPSNKKPLINLTCNGVLLPSDAMYEVLLKFNNEPYPSKDALAGSYGTFCIGKRVLNATKVVKTAWDRKKAELLIVLDMRTYSCTIKRATRFSFAVQLNDCPHCGACCVKPGDCGAKYGPGFYACACTFFACIDN